MSIARKIAETIVDKNLKSGDFNSPYFDMDFVHTVSKNLENDINNALIEYGNDLCRKAENTVTDLLFALRHIKGKVRNKDLIKIAKRIRKIAKDQHE